jgi:hypothetical protein
MLIFAVLGYVMASIGYWLAMTNGDLSQMLYSSVAAALVCALLLVWFLRSAVQADKG